MAVPESRGPRVRVAGLIELGERIVLVRHRAGDKTYHLLPGGGVGYRESLADALVREVKEETGLVVAPRDVIFVNDTIDPTGSRHVVNVTFACDVVGGELTDAPKDPRVEAVEVVALDQLPTIDLRPPFASQLMDAIHVGHAPQHYLGSLFVPG